MQKAQTKRNAKQKKRRKEQVALSRSPSMAVNPARPGRALQQIHSGAAMAKNNVLAAVASNKAMRESTKNAADIYKSIMLPYEFESVRYAGDTRAQPTVISTTFIEDSVDWSRSQDVTAAGGFYPPDGQFVAFVMRHPLRALIEYDPNPDGLFYTYVAQFPTAAGSRFPAMAVNPNGGIQGFRVDWANWEVDINSQYAPHGKQLYPIMHERRRGIYIDGNATKNGRFCAHTSDTTGKITVYKLVGKSWQYIGTASVSATIAQVNISAPGYYACEYASTAGSTVSVDFFISNSINTSGGSGGPSWAHLTCQGVSDMLQYLPSTRVTTAACLLTFVGSTLNNSGTVVAAQLTGGAQWWRYTNFTAIDALESHQRWRWEQGMYVVNLPTDESDWRMKDIAQTASVGGTVSLNDCYIDLDLSEPIVAIAVATSAIDASSGGQAEIRLVQTLEYPTNNPMLERKMPNVTDDDWKLAFKLLNLRETNFAYENPLHFKDILGKLIGAGEFALKHGPAVMSALSWLAAL